MGLSARQNRGRGRQGAAYPHMNTASSARWGIPDWTNPKFYPNEATDRVWRWEFLRRRPDYREAWVSLSAKANRIVERGGVRYAMGDPDELRLRFGVSVVHDPTRPMSDQELLFGGVFTPPGRKAAEG